MIVAFHPSASLISGFTDREVLWVFPPSCVRCYREEAASLPLHQYFVYVQLCLPSPPFSFKTPAVLCHRREQVFSIRD